MILVNFDAASPLKSNTTWFPLAVTAVALAPNMSVHTPPRSMAGYFFIRLKVKTTSLAVKSEPSVHFTPGRMSKVSLLAPCHLKPVASHGVTSQSRLLWIISGSYSQVLVCCFGAYGL